MIKNLSISCIVPTYNGLRLLQKHLESLFYAMDDGDEVIICDDASTDKTVEWLQKTYSLEVQNPQAASETEHILYRGSHNTTKKSISIIVMSNRTNLRFAKTVNRGVALCKNECFFLVNNDVSVERDALRVLKKQMLTDPSIFAIGCLEYEKNSKGKKSGKNKLWFEKGIFQHSKARDFETGPTAWASGGSALFSTAKWEELGGFDPAFYPAYWEDIDVSYRARKRGWLVLFNSDAVVYHKHESTNASTFGTQRLNNISWRNSFIFAWKHSNFFQKIQFLIWYPYWQYQRLKY